MPAGLTLADQLGYPFRRQRHPYHPRKPPTQSSEANGQHRMPAEQKPEANSRLTGQSADLGGSPRNAAEPSMEEILASIRRIIADDEPANETTESRQENVARESAAQAPPRPSAAPSHAAPMSPPPRIAPADAAAST